MNQPTNLILILDFGSQYTTLIARRLRECDIYCEIHPSNISAEQLASLQPVGIILSGSPETVTLANTSRVPDHVFKFGCPILGICYGMQVMALQLGGQVNKGLFQEGGYAKAKVEAAGIHWFKALSDKKSPQGDLLIDVWMSHGDEVATLPPGFELALSTNTTPIAGMVDKSRRFYGIQFHPEVTHTPKGKAILSHFAYQICQCLPSSQQNENTLAERQAFIRETVGNKSVLLGLSGGVDSTVLAMLLHSAIGDQLRCVFVDTGLIWEAHHTLIQTLAEQLKLPIVTIAAQNRFFTALKGVSDPEQKRKIIGQLFIKIFEEHALLEPTAHFLAQGTILSDVIESAVSPTHKGQTIKSHHNVGGLPPQMKLKLLEPLRTLFKDEVAKLGLTLGLPEAIIKQPPFPGPGLAIRILGEVTENKVRLLRQADLIFQRVLKAYHYDRQISQAFCVLLPINTVGVIGDARHYGPVIALRAIQTTDFMTARWVHLPYECLDAVSTQIINEIPEISRVVYDISSKPPATIEWE